MLELDLAGMSGYRLSQVIVWQRHASSQAISLKIHRPSSLQSSAIALIEISTREQMYEVAAQFGGSTFGSCAPIYLKQKSSELTLEVNSSTPLGPRDDYRYSTID